MVGLFERVGLKTNVGNTVGMVCPLCQAEVTFRDGVRDQDGGSRAFVPVEAAGLDSAQGVQGRYGYQVSSESHAYTAW